ncbi:MAG: MBL fold metallo-hydrolase [Elusimicrobia bacterium]|nr:MBL fold metallo-hydrolase [Elusimicrobiota bacterium]
MDIIKLPVGYLESNCYIVFDKSTKNAVIIDPGDEGENILDIIKKEKLKPLAIINTHGHYDHVGANDIIKNTLKIKNYFPEKDGEKKKFGPLELTFFHTPGHSKDGICILIENHIFSGDTLFAGSVGRTDLGGGSMQQLMDSITNKILTLPEETIVHPGHGPDTTIKREIQYNPFLENI